MGATGQQKLSNWSATGQIMYVNCGSNWSAKTSWSLAEPIGSSDHLPILIELNYVNLISVCCPKNCYMASKRPRLVLLYKRSRVENEESSR